MSKNLKEVLALDPKQVDLSTILSELNRFGITLPEDWFIDSEAVLHTANNWYNKFKFIPKTPDLFIANMNNIKDLKLLNKALKRFLKKETQINAVNMAITANIALERNTFDQYLALARKAYGLNDHDAINLLRFYAGCGRQVMQLMRNKLPLDMIIRKINIEGDYHLINVRDHVFANEAKVNGISYSSYPNIEERWLNRSRECVLPNIKLEHENYKLFLMSKDDPRGLFLGNYTACCQHPDGAGHGAAWYGATKPNAGFYVIEDDKGKIVSQTLAWINGDGLVLDSIESIRKQEDESMLKAYNLFSELAEIIEESHKLRVTVGEAYGTDFIKDMMFPVKDPISIPDDLSYSDADTQLSFNTKDEALKASIELIEWTDLRIIDEIIYEFGLIPYVKIHYDENRHYSWREYTVTPTKNKGKWDKIVSYLGSRSISGGYLAPTEVLFKYIEEEFNF